MSYKTRKELYEQLIAKRNRPLITYVTSIRPGMGASMAGDAIRPLIDQLSLVPREKREVDFLIVSNGGDPITSLRMMSLLRERFDKVSVLLPYVAYSAATVFSLGADEIIMHPYSNLGPVDPQLSVSHRDDSGNQERLQFSSEDLVNYIDFLKKDVGLTDQQHLVSSVQPLIKDVGSLAIGSAKRGQMLSLALSERMLSSHISDQAKVKSISRALNSSYYHHGYAVGRKEAREIDLPIKEPDEEIESILWSIWLDYEAEMKCNETFNPINELLQDPNSANALKTIPIVNMPANLPPEVQQAIFKQIVAQIKSESREALKISSLIASIESTTMSKAFYNDLSILYWRDINANLSYNITTAPSGWIDYRE